MLGGGSMATKSFLKNVEIKDKKLARKFVDALSAAEEKSAENSNKNIELSRDFVELKAEELKDFFGVK